MSAVFFYLFSNEVFFTGLDFMQKIYTHKHMAKIEKHSQLLLRFQIMVMCILFYAFEMCPLICGKFGKFDEFEIV